MKNQNLFSKLLEEAAAGQTTATRLPLPASAKAIIEAYQAAYQTTYNERPPNQWQVIYLLMTVGAERVKQLTEQMQEAASLKI